MIELKIDKYRIYVLDSVLNILQSHKQNNRKSLEAGGILLGQVTNDDIYVMKASTPSIKDKASRMSFERNKEIAQEIINYEFVNSDKKTIYLGEWHTHPEKLPKPSSVDLEMIFDQYRKNKLNEPFVLLIIQGLKGLFIALVSASGIKSVEYNDGQ